jgi:hypothetical protein
MLTEQAEMLNDSVKSYFITGQLDDLFALYI